MADDLTKIGKGDRIRVSLQKHEALYLAKKLRVSTQQAAGAIRAAGPSRAKVEAYIRQRKSERLVARPITVPCVNSSLLQERSTGPKIDVAVRES